MTDSHRGRLGRLRLLIPLLLVAAVAWAAAAYWRDGRAPSESLTASGTVEAAQVSAASKVPGRILRLHAGEGDTVRAGQTLVTIEGPELSAQLEQARAAAEAARARLRQAQVAQAAAGLDSARTRLQQARQTRDLTAAQSAEVLRQAEAAVETAAANSTAAKVNVDRAARDLARLQALYDDGAVSAAQVDAARFAHDAARAQNEASVKAVRQAEAAARVARANLRQVEIREQDIRAAEAQVRQAEAALRTARAGEELLAQRRADVATAEAQVAQAEAGVHLLLAQERNLVIAAPRGGVVVSKHASEGEIVGAGAPILTVAVLDEVWVRLFIPLPRLGGVVVGQAAAVTTEAFPGRVFAGAVTEIAQQAEFTPRNVQTQEERVKLVFAVKVTIPNPDRLLKPGMPADATIHAAVNRETTHR